MAFGRCVIRAVLFPYGNKFVTRYLDNQMNEKFGLEFAKILERTYLQIKDNMIDPVPDSDESENRAQAINQSKVE